MLTFSKDNDRVKDREPVKLYTFVKKGNSIGREHDRVLRERRRGDQRDSQDLAQRGHETLNTGTLAYVERQRGVYLDNFPDAPDAGEIQYYYAELVWQRAVKEPRNATEMWEKAAILFTIGQGQQGEPGKRKASAYAVLGWKNALDVDRGPRIVRPRRWAAPPPRSRPRRTSPSASRR
jgi:hypothetical protein